MSLDKRNKEKMARDTVTLIHSGESTTEKKKK